MKRRFQILIPALIILLSIAALSYAYFLIPNSSVKEENYKSYSYHLAFVSEDRNSVFSRELFQGAAEAGKDYDALVEQIGEDLNTGLSLEDAMNMAIYEKVDGILLRPNGSGQLEELVQKANDYGIPVITVQKDLADSVRQGFVGSNDYFLGQEYGKSVMEIAEEDTKLVTVLFPGNQFDNTSRSWFSQGLRNTVGEGKIQFDFRIIQDERGLNNAEDLIRDLLSEKKLPDIILCLDEVTTRSVSQLLKEQEGKLGKRPVLVGNSISDEILELILEGDVDSTIATDYREMGKAGLKALMSYKEYNMVSYYTEINTRYINRERAIEYREEQNAQNED